MFGRRAPQTVVAGRGGMRRGLSPFRNDMTACDGRAGFVTYYVTNRARIGRAFRLRSGRSHRTASAARLRLDAEARVARPSETDEADGDGFECVVGFRQIQPFGQHGMWRQGGEVRKKRRMTRTIRADQNAAPGFGFGAK